MGSHSKNNSTEYLIFMEIIFVAVKDGFKWLELVEKMIKLNYTEM